MSGKADDYFTIPLCTVCHNLEHSGHGMERLDMAKYMVRCLARYIQEEKQDGE